ncbi:MAG: M15 family metallopeptidase [Turicibacter sp.]
MVQKWLIPLGMVLMLILGLFYFTIQVSDEMALSLMGYSKSDIKAIVEKKPAIIKDLLVMKNRTDPEISYTDHVEFVMAEDFDVQRFTMYINLAQQYPDLTPSQIVFLDKAKENLIYPELKSLGYSLNTIESWFVMPEVMQYVKEEDEESIKQILKFARMTGEHVQKLVQYSAYQNRYPESSEDEVVENVNFFQHSLVTLMTEKGYESGEIERLYQNFSVPELQTISETDLHPIQTLELITASEFNMADIHAYSEVLAMKEDASVNYVIQTVTHSNVKGNFYNDIVETPNTDSLLVLVNPNYTLSKGYKPDDLVLLDVPLYHFDKETESNYLRREAAEATKKLFSTALDEKGYKLLVRCGYRSYETQQRYYDRFRWTRGTAYADSMSTRPGHSEHQTGLSIDITSGTVNSTFTELFGETPEGIWIEHNAHRFGFIIRYPNNRQSEIGNNYEPWHLRYVGIDVATEIYLNNWVLEDYILEYKILDKE